MTEDLAVEACTVGPCGRPQPIDSRLCETHRANLGDMLAQIRTEYERLSAAPSMEGREVGTIGGTGLSSQRSPGNTHVMALRDPRRGTGRIAYDDADPWGVDDTPSVFATFNSYADRVREGRDLAEAVAHVPACLFPCMHRSCLLGRGRPVRIPLTVETERALLVEKKNFRWILGQDWAGEFHDEIRGLYAMLRRANGHAAPARRVHRLEAPCPSCSVRALTHRPGTAAVTCENCGHAMDVPELAAASA